MKKMEKRTPGSPLSAAELEQRREAARARRQKRVEWLGRTESWRREAREWSMAQRRARGEPALPVLESRGAGASLRPASRVEDHTRFSPRGMHRGRLSPTASGPAIGEGGKFDFKVRYPEGWSEEKRMEYGRHLGTLRHEIRPKVMLREMERGNIPEDIDRRLFNRLYNHAFTLAMHDAGFGEYNFQMDDEQKKQFAPYEAFLTRARRYSLKQLQGTHAADLREYKQAFGKPWPDERRGPSGEIRLRYEPRHVIKDDEAGDLAKRTPGTPLSSAEHEQRKNAAQRSGELRQRARDLYHEHKGKIIPGLVGGAAAYGAATYGLNRGSLALVMRLANRMKPGADLARGTKPLGLKNLWASRGEFGAHIGDLWRRPTAVGRTPSRKEIRRALARSSMASHERLILTGDDGRVLVNAKGSGSAVAGTPKMMEAIERAIKGQKRVRTFHNHPVDTVPSNPDARFADMLRQEREAATHGDKSYRDIAHYVYSNSRLVPSGKTRTRVTRYNEAGDYMPLKMKVADKDIKTPRLDVDLLEEKDWLSTTRSLGARQSNSRYRTKAIEKLAKRTPGTPLSEAEMEQRREAARERWRKDSNRRMEDVARTALFGGYGATIGVFGGPHLDARLASYPFRAQGKDVGKNRRIRRAIFREARKDRDALRQIYQSIYRETLGDARPDIIGGDILRAATDDSMPRGERLARAAARKVYEEALAQGSSEIDAQQVAVDTFNKMRVRAGLPPITPGGTESGAKFQELKSDARRKARDAMWQWYHHSPNYAPGIDKASRPRANDIIRSRVIDALKNPKVRLPIALAGTAGAGIAGGAMIAHGVKRIRMLQDYVIDDTAKERAKQAALAGGGTSLIALAPLAYRLPRTLKGKAALLAAGPGVGALTAYGFKATADARAHTMRAKINAENRRANKKALLDAVRRGDIGAAQSAAEHMR